MPVLPFLKMQAPILPVHDSFLVHHGYEAELPEIMTKAAQAVIGIPLASSLKRQANSDTEALVSSTKTERRSPR